VVSFCNGGPAGFGGGAMVMLLMEAI
jgi:hypothetical protein